MDLEKEFKEKKGLDAYIDNNLEPKIALGYYVEWLEEQLLIQRVSKSLPTEDCVRDWWREGSGDEYFWKHETDWSNEQVFREIYQALTYFIKRWQ